MSATPSSDDSENSCISASTPDERVLLGRLGPGRIALHLRQQPLHGTTFIAAVHRSNRCAQWRLLSHYFVMKSRESRKKGKSVGRMGGVVHIGLSRKSRQNTVFCLLRFYSGYANINSAFTALIANYINLNLI